MAGWFNYWMGDTFGDGWAHLYIQGWPEQSAYPTLSVAPRAVHPLDAKFNRHKVQNRVKVRQTQRRRPHVCLLAT